ncbi:MAG: 30S ribosomal protein S27e [Candidatus Nanoarchaeia archaeon]
MFVKVQCGKCNNEQIMFHRSANVVNCLVCEEGLAKPTGGKAVITANVVEHLK